MERFLGKILQAITSLKKTSIITLVATFFFGISGLVYSQLGYDHAREPFDTVSTFFISYEDSGFIFDKSPTSSGGLAEVFFCQQGIGMALMLSFEYLDREQKQPVPEVSLPQSTVSLDLPISYLIHISHSSGTIETSFHTFDAQNLTRITSGHVPGEHLTCSDIY